MTVTSCPDRVRSLLDYLDGLKTRAQMGALEAHLRALDIGVAEIAGYAQFSEDHYLRNLVREGRWYHLLVICWRSGQRSPIHNHIGSTCGVRVLTGVATETVFETTPSLRIKAVSSSDMRAGDVGVRQDRDIHQVSNLQAPGTDLITLHIYSPPLFRMDTYSLIDGTVGEFRPMIMEHAFGSGI